MLAITTTPRAATAYPVDMDDVSGNNVNYFTGSQNPIDSCKYTTLVGEFENSDSPHVRDVRPGRQRMGVERGLDLRVVSRPAGRVVLCQQRLRLPESVVPQRQQRPVV